VSAPAGGPDPRSGAPEPRSGGPEPGSGAPDPVVHRRYVPHSHAHYGGGLVDGAYTLGLFGDAATEFCIRAGGDEGLFAGYQQVTFHAPVRAGDVLETRAELVATGTRSRALSFSAWVLCRAAPERGPSAADVLETPLLVVSAVGTVVLPARRPVPGD
jgi:3-aminobutyryl-CoA ammonia-lyase